MRDSRTPNAESHLEKLLPINIILEFIMRGSRIPNQQTRKQCAIRAVVVFVVNIPPLRYMYHTVSHSSSHDKEKCRRRSGLSERIILCRHARSQTK